MHNGLRHIKYYRKRKEKTKRILITKERTKKHGERITRGKSPSPRPVEKGATERSKQLVISAFMSSNVRQFRSLQIHHIKIFYFLFFVSLSYYDEFFAHP